MTTTTSTTATATGQIRRFIRDFDFKPLFIETLGWDNFKAAPIGVTVGASSYTLLPLAQKRGVGVFLCEPDAQGGIPDYATRKKIDAEVLKLHHEHVIVYVDADKIRQIWQWVKRQPGKPTAFREEPYSRGQSGERLAQRLAQLYVDLLEEESLTLTEAAGRVQHAFDVDRVTKRFYDRFQKEHAAFLKDIEGIAAPGDREWYASLMLNRLMFSYFIQKKGFLNGDRDYLRTKLAQTRARFGTDQFHTFYREFLLHFFHDGLGAPKGSRSPEIRALIGDIPYLNGGLFETHAIERANPEIAIPDAAFERVFDFFDAYSWHLDDRPTGADNEINPDVLGYIFEKYINQKQMGAYYTKEDITGYIGKNTILPFLLEAAKKGCSVAFDPGGEVWRLLRDDPDRYIYDAVRKGVDIALPADIVAGVHDVARRSGWNRPAAPEYALPTETWREHVARRARCLDLRAKLARGEVTEVNDLITYNLDIVVFARDVIERCEGPELLRALWKALSSVTVLDPTCGSGAFLFAALRLLEPLYEACLLRMESFVAEFDRTAQKRAGTDFRETLRRMAEHPSRAYFIRKAIILNNLYGVDIMEEAVEIAKLRLFLALVSQAETLAQIEPLPDIDFNIRAGNTLVGFATFAEAERAVSGHLFWREQMPAIREQAEDLARLFTLFREQQTIHGGRVTKEDKQELRDKLAALGDTLDRFLAAGYGIDESHLPNPAEYEAKLAAWRASHQPFHWFVEFYAIVQARGGFDVIIGNPPYVEWSRIKDYDLVSSSYKTRNCGNLYTTVCERSYSLLGNQGHFGMIVPISCVATARMESFRSLWAQELLETYASHYSGDAHPSVLFQGVKFRLSILIQRKNTSNSKIYSTHFQRWLPENRAHLFSLIEYVQLAPHLIRNGLIPKLATKVHTSILQRICTSYSTVGVSVRTTSPYQVYAHRIVAHFVKALDFVPFFRNERDGEKKSEDYKIFPVESLSARDTLGALLNSSLFYSWFVSYSDVYHCGREVILDFPCSLTELADALGTELHEIEDRLMDSLRANSVRRSIPYKATGMVQYDEFYPRLSKPIIDEIDRVLAQHYGFTDEELDFILNYDIKYRLGAESDNGENGNNGEE